MKEGGPGGHPNQEFTDPEREQRRQQELLDGTNLLPELLKERMPALYSQEHERDPLVMDTNKEKVDILFFGLVVGHVPELGYFSLNELKTGKEGLRGIRAL